MHVNISVVTSAGFVCGHRSYLLLLGVELKALSQGAGLRLVVLLPVQIHTLSVRDVLLLRVSKQAAGGGGVKKCTAQS